MPATYSFHTKKKKKTCLLHQIFIPKYLCHCYDKRVCNYLLVLNKTKGLSEVVSVIKIAKGELSEIFPALL